MPWPPKNDRELSELRILAELDALNEEWLHPIYDAEHDVTVPITKPSSQAAQIFMNLLPIVQRYDRERRMGGAALSAEEIRRASDLDLATRMRLRREKK